MRRSNFAIFSSDDMSGALTSEPVSLFSIYGFSIQLVYTGSPDGEMKLQGSNDASFESQAYINPTNWTDLSGTAIAIAAAGSYIYNYSLVPFNWVRVVWTPSSGSGSLSGRINIKGN